MKFWVVMKRRLVFLLLFVGSFAFARFLEVDPKREFFNPYSYVGNNPILAIDPNGEEIFFMQGTWQDSGQFRSGVRKVIAASFNDKDSGYSFPGKLLLRNRGKAAAHLFEQVKSFHEANPSAPLNLVGQSHGGNVFMHKRFLSLVHEYNQNSENPIVFDNVVLLNTPIRKRNQPDYDLMKNVIVVSVENDYWQKLGGAVPGRGKSTLPPPAVNIFVSRDQFDTWFKSAFGDIAPSKNDVHMQSANHPDFWETFVSPVLSEMKDH